MQKEILLMGILNITPNSFYDGGRYIDFGSAKKQLHLLEENGADIIDIGGESSRPGSFRISQEEENNRLQPIFNYIYETKCGI